jgi:hypothetical protein
MPKTSAIERDPFNPPHEIIGFQDVGIDLSKAKLI